MLAEVQQAREDLGTSGLGGRPASAVTTTRMRPVSDPTVVVSPVHPSERPSWARLPEYGARRRAPGPSWIDRLRLPKVMAGPGTRLAMIAALVALGLVVVLGAWWFGVGRYTDAPSLVNLSRAQAEAQGRNAGFAVVIGPGRYREDVKKDVVLAQDPGSGERVVKGTTITLTLSLGPERVAVPDVVGQTLAVASAQLQEKKLKPVRGRDQYDSTTPAGSVLAVKPAVNTEVKPGTQVTLTVSKGPPPVTVPNVVGQNIAQVQGQLQQQGLIVDVEQVESPDHPAGQVLDQDPKAGTGVEKGTHVKLKVSRGPSLVVVPRVVDLPCQQGKQTLEGIGLPVTVQGNDQLTVRFQNPSENTQVPPGTGALLICF
jgi:serine/threonine-protein kinase